MKNKLNISIMLTLLVLVMSATANAESYFAYLTSAQEVPTNASTGRGYARMTYDPATKTLNLSGVYSGMSSAVAAAHIHNPGAIGVNGPVIITLTQTGGTSGTLSGNAVLTAQQESDLRAHLMYVNVHTANFSGGEIRGQLAGKRPVDFDGDGRTDYSVLRFPGTPAPGVNGITYYNNNSTTGFQSSQWGDANRDFPVPGDYDGDFKDDFALYRAGATAGAQSFFLILRSSDNTAQYTPFGQMGDQAVARDYDGDGKTDIAIFRRAVPAGEPATWYILQSTTGTFRGVSFGIGNPPANSGDTPVPGDYDGDGKFDIAVYRFGTSAPANTFIILNSSNNSFTIRQFGDFQSDYIAPGDFDGDGKTDLVAARTGAAATSPIVWYILQSSNNQIRITTFGASSDLPTQGDYDGDGRTDIAVYRRGATATSGSFFYVLNSLNNGFLATQWGLSGDFPVATFDAR